MPYNPYAVDQGPQGFAGNHHVVYSGDGASAVPPAAGAPTPQHGHDNRGQFGGFNPSMMFKTYREDMPYMGNGGLFYTGDNGGPFSNFPLFSGMLNHMDGGNYANGGNYPTENYPNGLNQPNDRNYGGGPRNYLRPPTAPWAQNPQQTSTYGGYNALLGMK